MHRLIRLPMSATLSKLIGHVVFGIAVTDLVDPEVFGSFEAGTVPPAPILHTGARDAMEAIHISPALPSKGGISSLHAR
ncbi:hypothetical protein BDP55DRAFT_673810, partial [Colletotrichum godetiae]